MVFVISKAKRTKSTIHAIQAIHIAFTPMSIGMELAMNKKACLKQWSQPWRPLHFLFIILIIWTSSSLNYNPNLFYHQINKTIIIISIIISYYYNQILFIYIQVFQPRKKLWQLTQITIQQAGGADHDSSAFWFDSSNSCFLINIDHVERKKRNFFP